jgi:hypothetical protein
MPRRTTTIATRSAAPITMINRLMFIQRIWGAARGAGRHLFDSLIFRSHSVRIFSTIGETDRRSAAAAC